MFRVYGPSIVAATLSKLNVEDTYGNRWAYHSQSDHHSKLCCWVVLLDLMRNCSLLRTHAQHAHVGFGINHEIVDFKQNRKKNFDLVLCTPRTMGVKSPSVCFRDLADKFKIVLTAEQQHDLSALPDLLETPVGSVQVAFEAKACMTEQDRKSTRLNSSHER